MSKKKGQNYNTVNHSKDLVETRAQVEWLTKRVAVLVITNEQLKRRVEYLNEMLDAPDKEVP